MTTAESPDRQLTYLQQCLSNDKKPLGLFLGAGCPLAIPASDGDARPLIPDLAGVTEIVRESLMGEQALRPLLEEIDKHFVEDKVTEPTVEDLLTHVRGLRVVAGNATVRGLSATELDKLDRAVCDVVYEVADKLLPAARTPYHDVARWVEAVRREAAVEIFTTNYDLLMEQALEDSRVPYFDGFAGVREPFFDLRAMEEDVLPQRWARLWKLHGSINWYEVEHKGVSRSTTTSDPGSKKRVIYPSHLKYQESRRMPYLAMIDRLRAFLKQPAAALILCGYSFRDDHINEVIVQGLESTPTAIAFALMYDTVGKLPKLVALATKRSNLTVLARDGAVVSAREAKWPEADAESVIREKRVGLRWVSVDPKDASAKQRAEFELGDFAVLGRFLRDLVGTVRELRDQQRA
jgi:hypothetical protein